MSERWGDSRSDRDALDRWLTRDDDRDDERDFEEEAYNAATMIDEIEDECPEWGGDHRYEEQETWDHRIVVGCNCGAVPPIDYLRDRFNP